MQDASFRHVSITIGVASAHRWLGAHGTADGFLTVSAHRRFLRRAAPCGLQSYAQSCGSHGRLPDEPERDGAAGAARGAVHLQLEVTGAELEHLRGANQILLMT